MARRLLPLLFWAAFLFAFVMATLPKPPSLPGDPGDKVQHILAFAVLALLAAIAYSRVRLWIIALCLCLFGAVIEGVQAIPSLHRDSDALDWVADTVAACAVLLVIGLARRNRNA